ncbi:MAG: class I SAM-dependent methyltransferase [Pseudomonadota bacterium]
MTVTPDEFWDRIAPRYSKQAISDPESYARKLETTQALMRADMTVLELGCGTGSTALAHAAHVAHIEATDVSGTMLDIGRQRAAQADVSNVCFVQSSVESYENDSRFDMVLALNLMHLLPDRRAALAKIHRLLKPGGYFISSTVCLADRLWYLRPVIPLMQWLGKAPYVSFVPEKDWLREVAAAGFDSQEHWTHAGRANSVFLVTTKRQAVS